ncbi:HEAT repeat domain-containing protein [Bradyrhizobium sp.]|uniref:HEAT repeat domain-containing protein n=1 Tax=Bradyrhizobium sp. TaxID=376 RepID=UPI002D2BBBA3|nr:HEAT repeat domain-containing protein [Bradyrhizobium sp.]HZR72784.1 HEAT repeat domain-containing protein [Bradyrhizobium sp.]
MSDAFDRFRYSFFEDPTSARDGLDIASLRAIEDYERGEAERLLLAFLPDARAVIGLGVLRSAKAEVELSRLFDTERKQQIDARNDPAMQPGGSNEWYPSAMLYLAQALWRIRPEPRWPQAVIEVLASARDWVFRHEAVLVLAGIGEPDAVEALVNAFDDEEPLVRHGAARALLTLHGLPADFTDPQAVTIRIMSRDAARRETARLGILAVIAGRALVRE